MKKVIPYGRQHIQDDDIREVVRALKSDMITQGPRIGKFEDLLCGYTGAKYAVALSSGTAALHISMLALGVGPGDRALTSPITFSASANCVRYAGGTPGFIDIDDHSYHMDLERLKAFLKSPSRRKNVKAVIPVHFMGTVSDVVGIKDLCDRYGIKIVEDAAHALGSRYKGRTKAVFRVGSSAHSDATVFSFHPIKHITTGEGGAILTNNRRIYEAARRLRHHGIVKPRKGYWSYDIAEIGFNYRITDIQCALGVSQLKKLDNMVNKRRRLVENYNDAFRAIDEIKLPYEREGTYSSYHLYVIRVPAGRRDRLYGYLQRHNILAQVNYIPVHLLSYYKKKYGYKYGSFPVSERYFKECLSLPLFPELSKGEQSRVIDKVREFFSKG
jgi:UDP-4-amino-4,6-dideoxy-N-acetyl-beta-L-altrosamine transaminase